MTDITTTRGRPETGAPTTYDQRAVAPTRWSADADRTSVDFAVKTFWGLLTVRGHFDRFSGSYEVGPDGARIELTIDADSLDTGNAPTRPAPALDHFFAVAEHPKVRFASTRVREFGDGRLRVEGDLHAAGKSWPSSSTPRDAARGGRPLDRGDHDGRPEVLGMGSVLLE